MIDIYCKVGCDQFPEPPWINDLSGINPPSQLIYDFLMADCGCFDNVSGDHNIWYLCCCEKFGELSVDGKMYSWSFGESSPDIVKDWLNHLHKLNILNDDHHISLLKQIEFARNNFDIHYDIADWFKCKQSGGEWVKPTGGKAKSKAFFAQVIDAFPGMTGISDIKVANID
jgi:hypothetical protein